LTPVVVRPARAPPPHSHGGGPGGRGHPPARRDGRAPHRTRRPAGPRRVAYPRRPAADRHPRCPGHPGQASARDGAPPRTPGGVIVIGSTCSTTRGPART